MVYGKARKPEPTSGLNISLKSESNFCGSLAGLDDVHAVLEGDGSLGRAVVDALACDVEHLGGSCATNHNLASGCAYLHIGAVRHNVADACEVTDDMAGRRVSIVDEAHGGEVAVVVIVETHGRTS